MPLDMEHKREWTREYQRKNRERIREYKRKWRLQKGIIPKSKPRKHGHPVKNVDVSPEKTDTDEWYERAFSYRNTTKGASEPVNPWIR